MADIFEKIEAIKEKIRTIKINFKKDPAIRKTSEYLNKRINYLNCEYEKYLSLEKNESFLLNSGGEDLEKLYRDVYALLDNCVPYTKTKSKSAEKLNYLGIPESSEVLNGRLHLSQNKLEELSRNVTELTEHLINALEIVAEADDFESIAERLEYVLSKDAEYKLNLEKSFGEKINILDQTIINKEKTIKNLEDILEAADRKEEHNESQIEEIFNREKIHTEKIRYLLEENQTKSEKINNTETELINTKITVKKLESDLKNIILERNTCKRKLESLEQSIDGDISEKGKENYKRIIETLNGEITNEKRENLDLQRLIENYAKTSLQAKKTIQELTEKLNLCKVIDKIKMEQYTRIIKGIKDTIPMFSGGKSGTLTSDVKQFVSCCELIYGKLTAEEKKQFIEIIKIKFTGDAADLMNNSTYETLEDLKDILFRAYIPKRTFQSYMDELKRSMQRPGERLEEFGLRISKLLLHCQQEARKEYNDGNSALLKSIEKDAMKAYRMGITNSAIKYHLATSKQENLAKVMEVAEELNEDCEYGQSIWTTDAPVSQFNAAPAFLKESQGPSTSNFVEKRRDLKNESQNNYWQGSQNFQNTNRNPGFNGSIQRNGQNRQVSEGFARGSGGNYNGRSNRSQNRTEPVTCHRCGRRGHAQSDCRTRPENVFCTKCKLYGHIAANCQSNVAMVNTNQNNGIKCRFCQRLDHLIGDCLYKREYEKGLQQQGNEQAESTDTVGLH